MTHSFDETRRSLARLGAAVVPVRERETNDRRRERIIGAVNQQAVRVHESRRRHRIGLALLSAAAVLGLVLAVSVLMRAGTAQTPSPVVATHATDQQTQILAIDGTACWVQSKGGERAAEVGTELAGGEDLVTAEDTRVHLRMRDKVDVRMSPESKLRVPGFERATWRLMLVRGTGAFSVQPLPTGQRFAVTTPNAKVVVHGTRFVVRVDGAGSDAATTVKVTEGRVEVTSSGQTVFLLAGQSWSSRAAERSAPKSAAPPVSAAEASEGTRSTQLRASLGGSATARQLGSEPAPSTLAEETRAYMEAMALKRQGEDARALARLEDFLRRYPSSPLTENAQVERLRLLAALGRHSAAAEGARRYVSEHPDGFARTEAQEMAAPSSSTEPRER